MSRGARGTAAASTRRRAIAAAPRSVADKATDRLPPLFGMTVARAPNQRRLRNGSTHRCLIVLARPLQRTGRCSGALFGAQDMAAHGRARIAPATSSGARSIIASSWRRSKKVASDR